jgi:hypothetical protein
MFKQAIPCQSKLNDSGKHYQILLYTFTIFYFQADRRMGAC